MGIFSFAVDEFFWGSSSDKEGLNFPWKTHRVVGCEGNTLGFIRGVLVNGDLLWVSSKHKEELKDPEDLKDFWSSIREGLGVESYAKLEEV